MGDRKAIVVGAAGQDGQLLRDALRSQGAEVVGVDRGGVVSARSEWNHRPLDVCDRPAVLRLVGNVQPHEIYYLAAHHNASEGAVESPGELLESSLRTNVLGLVAFLEAIRTSGSPARLFYAGSSHVFGHPRATPQDETTAFNPENAYGISKAAGIFACRLYRANHDVFASTGILYNHESWLRRETFVSRKIVMAVAAIRKGDKSTLALGNLEARVDWGFAPDYVTAMQCIVRHRIADDFVVASGQARTVREFAQVAFAAAGLDYREHVVGDPSLPVRPQPPLVGNSAKLKSETGWRPTVSFEEMVNALVQRELAAA